MVSKGKIIILGLLSQLRPKLAYGARGITTNRIITFFNTTSDYNKNQLTHLSILCRHIVVRARFESPIVQHFHLHSTVVLFVIYVTIGKHKRGSSVVSQHTVSGVGWFNLRLSLQHPVSTKELFYPRSVGQCWTKFLE